MKTRLIALVLMVFLCAATAAAQGAPSRPPTRAEIIAAARTVAGKARYAALVTLDDSGQPQARVVDPFALEDDLAIWIATNPLSRKAIQIAADPRVTLLYFDTTGENSVTVIGTARLVKDPTEKAKRWKEDWVKFYKDRNRGDDYLLIRVDPTRLEVVAGALGMANDPVTWRPVILDLK